MDIDVRYVILTLNVDIDSLLVDHVGDLCKLMILMWLHHSFDQGNVQLS